MIILAELPVVGDDHLNNEVENKNKIENFPISDAFDTILYHDEEEQDHNVEWAHDTLPWSKILW